jgi:hypothetical protein
MSNFDNNKDIEPIIEHIKRYHFWYLFLNSSL